MCYGVGGLASRDTLRIREIVVESDERLPIRVESVSAGIGQRIVGIVVTALLVLCFMIDGCCLDGR